MFRTGRRQPNSPSKNPPDPGPALWKCSLISSGWWCWPCFPSSPWSMEQSPSPICSSNPLPHLPCSQDAGDPASSWSCSCSWRTLFSKCWPSLLVESTLSAVFRGLIPPSIDSSSWPGVCRGTGRCVGGARSVMIWGGKLVGTWGGWGWELGEFDFFMASPTTVSFSSSFSLPTRRLGQEVQESTSGELPMMSCMGFPEKNSWRGPSTRVCLNAGIHLQNGDRESEGLGLGLKKKGNGLMSLLWHKHDYKRSDSTLWFNKDKCKLLISSLRSGMESKMTIIMQWKHCREGEVR